ncbi:TPA: type I glyceraldehyde-3-phosphate dehydrogenase [Candidatus Saccharibacteria bacterium]|nr:MAG: Glyceraldehyde-3-phosphate dehydrogenase, type I [Candidatus Saccharibacteria bacterium GW2011_GWA2_46_10]HCM51651.1 type I glyceraldehyde-3-phosphate dehydrogenase [Candidatus Saccharibacteria bacterium]
MKTKIGINGFGRVGRCAFKIAFERDDVEVVAINDITDTKTLAHLLKHDSNYGEYQHDVSFNDQNLIVDGQKIRVLAEKEPAKLPWKDLNVAVVIESTGLFVDPEKARAHIEAGAKKVIISAPAKGEGAETIVLGVNEDKLESAGEIISNASCTTNCITPVMAVIEEAFGIEKAMMTTIHSYTASQRLLDAPAKDLREARNAATNIVPTTTGASIAAAKAMPTLEGLFGGMSIRVPTPVVSLSDFVIITKRDVTKEEVNGAFKKAADDPYYQGILAVTEEPLVSSDFIGSSYSAIVDLALTDVVGGNLLKVVAWYDNEWGYSNRLVELTADAAKTLGGDSAEDSSEENQQPEAKKEKSEFKTADQALDETSEQPEKADEEPLLEAPETEDFLPAPEQTEAKSDIEVKEEPLAEDKPLPSNPPESKSKDEFEDPGARPSNIDGFHKF